MQAQQTANSDNAKDKSSAGLKKKKPKKTEDDGGKSRGSSSEKKGRKKSTPKSVISEDNQSHKSKTSKERRKSKSKKDDKKKDEENKDNDLQSALQRNKDIDNNLRMLQISVQQHANGDKCVHHELEFQFFCESCEEPICRQCTIMGPHNNQLHRINRMDESFRARVGRLTETISLIPKRDQLLAQIHRLEYRIEEIRYVKTIIERDARAEYGGVIERLKSAEGVKVAVLQHEMSEIQKDLDRINDIGHSFNEFSSDADKPVPFLLRARNLYENIEFQVAKPFKQNIDVYPYDLPRELTELRLQLQRVHAQKALIEFKNEVIWKQLEEKKQIEQNIRQEMENAAYVELQEWAKLTEKYSSELKKFYLVCHYCNIQMDENTINHRCHQNKHQQLNSEFKGFTQKQPDNKFHGTQKHFFARPYEGQPGINSNQIPNESIELPQRNFQQTKVNRNNQQVQLFIEAQMDKIKHICAEEGIDIGEVFKKHDKQKNGYVSQIQFSYIMTDILQTSDKEAERLYKFFTGPKDQPVINYNSFIEVMENLDKIEDFINNQ